MQKWCPEPLAPDTARDRGFVAVAAAPGERTGFRPEAGFADQANLLGQLSREERAQLVDLVELDLRAEYEARLTAATAEMAAAHAAELADARAAIACCEQSFAAGAVTAFETATRDLADAAVTLAVQLAEKMVRARVEADTGVLVRALETILFKAEPGVQLDVTCHPDDAALFTGSPELRARLRIGEVKPDRRIERGGCLVRAGDLEWDATLQRQLSVLEEVARAALAGDAAPEEGTGHDPACLG
jgi:flagellar biosynthesis/type III secretory pathway protein FliH